MTSATSKTPSVTVLHLHAGAFVSAPEAGRVTVIEQLLIQAGASVSSLRYPLAPEHPFPQAVNAAYESLQQLSRAKHGKAKIFVAGVEAGGNIAAGVALMLRDRGELPLAGQILFSPMLDPRLATHSMRCIGAGHPGCRLAHGWHAYTPRPCDGGHPYANPAAAMRLHGLPPTLLFTADDDPFRDEARAYAQRLLDNGVDAAVVSLPSSAAYMKEADEASAPAPWKAVALDSLRRFLSGAALH